MFVYLYVPVEGRSFGVGEPWHGTFLGVAVVSKLVAQISDRHDR